SLRASKARWRRRYASLEKRRRKRRRSAIPRQFQFSVPNPARPRSARKRSARIFLKLPKILDIIDRYDETVAFMGELRAAAAASQASGVTLIFDAVEEIRPGAMLLLLAEIDRCRRIFSKRRVTGTYPNNQKLE